MPIPTLRPARPVGSRLFPSQHAVFALVALLACFASASAHVVINEILYHAPDDLHSVQFIELHNPDPAPAQLDGWSFSKGIRFEFPQGSRIEPGGFLVLCQNRDWFRRFYSTPTFGEFSGVLRRGGERIELINHRGEIVDSLKYNDRAPWPTAADGLGPSMERICPSAPSSLPDNWMASPFPIPSDHPGGSPGATNHAHRSSLPPIVHRFRLSPPDLLPGVPWQIAAEIDSPTSDHPLVAITHVDTISAKGELSHASFPMQLLSGTHFEASVPPAPPDSIVRIRIHVATRSGNSRWFPSATDPRPCLSYYIPPSSPAPQTTSTASNPPPSLPQLRLIHPISLPASSVALQSTPTARSTHSHDATPSHQGDTLALWFPEAGQPPRVFDFVSTTPRPGGLKLHLHRDRPLQSITTLNLVYDSSIRNILAEALAYQLYQLAGYPAPQTSFIRVFDNHRPVGFHLAIEQPNKSFLRRIGKPDNGILYKSTESSASFNHTPDSAAISHEKKSYPHLGRHDLVQLFQKIQNASRIELWESLCRDFDADLVITFFALNSLLSHWDGFADGYFLYHDNEDSKRWTFFPWDLDNTFGFYPGISAHQIFANMPLHYGALSPSIPASSPPSPWQRPPGPFSGPFLSNPHFQHHFHARIRDLLASLFSEDVLFPILENFRTQLTPAVQERAQLNAAPPDLAVQQLNASIQSIQTNIAQRRLWLLQQPEIQRAAAYDRTAFKRNR